MNTISMQSYREGPITEKLYCGPKPSELDERGRRLYFRSCDLMARFWLNKMGMPEFDAGNFEGCWMLIHAERYLSGRLAYELAPWPHGKMPVDQNGEMVRVQWIMPDADGGEL